MQSLLIVHCRVDIINGHFKDPMKSLIHSEYSMKPSFFSISCFELLFFFVSEKPNIIKHSF